MKLIIDIDESLLDGIKSDDFDFARRVVKNFQGTIASAIANGTPIPDNATFGDVIEKITNRKPLEDNKDADNIIISIKLWNAPYQKGGKE